MPGILRHFLTIILKKYIFKFYLIFFSLDSLSIAMTEKDKNVQNKGHDEVQEL